MFRGGVFMSVVGHRWPIAIILVALAGGTAQAREDLDRDQFGAKLFATTCTNCHRSPRGLTMGRVSWTLSNFLQQHYTSGSASAQKLTSYLQSVDVPRAKPQKPPRKSRPMTPGASSLRAPASTR